MIHAWSHYYRRIQHTKIPFVLWLFKEKLFRLTKIGFFSTEKAYSQVKVEMRFGLILQRLKIFHLIVFLRVSGLSNSGAPGSKTFNHKGFRHLI